MGSTSASTSCGPSGALSSVSAHFYSNHEHRNLLIGGGSGSSSGSLSSGGFRTLSSFQSDNALREEDEYSADFSPESFTKRFFFPSAGSSSKKATAYTLAPTTPLLPPTPCVPYRPLDANKGYILPNSCFTDIDWIAEFNNNKAYAAVPTDIVPPQVPPMIPQHQQNSAPRTSYVHSGSAQSKSSSKEAKIGSGFAPSISNSLVQTDIDGDDSEFWYKSTTRFASPADEWDYERLRRRIKEFTTLSDSSQNVDARGLGTAAAVNDQVRQATVRRLKVILAHLTGFSTADQIASDKKLEDFDFDLLAEGENVDISRLRQAIAELSLSSASS
ncbi:hypothetical protein V1511DRAFT_461601 [Dipodascopsis uninucleata]